MSLTTYREVCADLLRGLEELKHPRLPFPGYITASMDRARWLLAQPAPAEPASPVDLDALLSPAGAYETAPDAGNQPGSQLVCDQHGGNPTWWDPVYGCISLGDLLDQIRSRILPHLRPPVVGIDIPGPDGDYGDIADLCRAEGVSVVAGARLLRRARAAWGQASAAPAEPADHIRNSTEMVAPPAEGEVGELTVALRRVAPQNPMGVADPTCTSAAALLQQQAAELATLRKLREEILDLASESTGVAGLHLNGDIAPWDELLPGGRYERLTSLPDPSQPSLAEERPHV